MNKSKTNDDNISNTSSHEKEGKSRILKSRSYEEIELAIYDLNPSISRLTKTIEKQKMSRSESCI